MGKHIQLCCRLGKAGGGVHGASLLRTWLWNGHIHVSGWKFNFYPSPLTEFRKHAAPVANRKLILLK